MKTKSLTELKTGELAKISHIDGIHKIYFMQIGLVTNTKIRKISDGNPSAYAFRGTAFAFRDQDAVEIKIISM